MDVFLLIQDERVRATEPPFPDVDGFPEVNKLLRTINAEDSSFRSIAPASAVCEQVQQTTVRCVCHLTVAYKAPKLNTQKESFYMLFDRLTEFVERQKTEVDTVIEAWLLPTQYEQQNVNGWSIGFSVYGYAQSENEAKIMWMGAVRILQDFIAGEISK